MAEAQYDNRVPSAQLQPTRGIDAIKAVHNAIARVNVRPWLVGENCKRWLQ